jgi:hypothetical protein
MAGRGGAMLERAIVYVYLVLLAVGLLLEWPMPLAIAP